MEIPGRIHMKWGGMIEAAAIGTSFAVVGVGIIQVGRYVRDTLSRRNDKDRQR
jgi:hypothetical protein